MTSQNPVDEENANTPVRASSPQICIEEGSHPVPKILGNRKPTDVDNDSASDDGVGERDDEELYVTESGKRMRENVSTGVAKTKATQGSTSRKEKEPQEIQSDSDMEDFEGFEREYYTVTMKNRWKFYGFRQCICEKVIDVSFFVKYDVYDLLRNTGMLSTVSYAEPYIEKAIKLFYANITQKFGEEESKKFGKSYVRHRMYRLTPAIINAKFGFSPLVEEEEINDFDAVASPLSGGRVTAYKE